MHMYISRKSFLKKYKKLKKCSTQKALLKWGKALLMFNTLRFGNTLPLPILRKNKAEQTVYVSFRNDSNRVYVIKKTFDGYVYELDKNIETIQPQDVPSTSKRIILKQRFYLANDIINHNYFGMNQNRNLYDLGRDIVKPLTTGGCQNELREIGSSAHIESHECGYDGEDASVCKYFINLTPSQQYNTFQNRVCHLTFFSDKSRDNARMRRIDPYFYHFALNKRDGKEYYWYLLYDVLLQKFVFVKSSRNVLNDANDAQEITYTENLLKCIANVFTNYLKEKQSFGQIGVDAIIDPQNIFTFSDELKTQMNNLIFDENDENNNNTVNNTNMNYTYPNNYSSYNNNDSW